MLMQSPADSTNEFSITVPKSAELYAVRFTAPVYPGETLRFQIWKEGGGLLRLRARVALRDVTVLDNGLIELRD